MKLFKCKKCLETKDISLFPEHPDCRNGIDTSRCIECKNEASKRSYHESSREKKIFNRARSRAKKKGIPFNIEITDITVPDVCPVFGTPLIDESIDRMDPNLGYVKSNINIISMRANIIKGNATLEELEAVVKWMKQKACEII